MRRPGRALLSATGISLSIALGICIFSLSAGIDASIHSIIEEVGVDIYVVPEGAPVFFQDMFPPISDSRDISRTLLGNENITAAGPRLIGSLYLTSLTSDEMDDLDHDGGIGEDELKVYHAITRGRVPEMDGDFGGETVISGEYLPTRDDPFYQNGKYEGGENSSHFTHEIVLDEGLAEVLDVNVGDRIFASNDFPQLADEVREWWNTTVYFDITGIVTESYETRDMLSCIVHLSELQYMLGLTKFDGATKIFVELRDGADPGATSKWIDEESPYHGKISAYTKEEYEADLIHFSEVMKSFGEMITIITTVVSVIFVATVVVISVKERTNEIGILKAIGIPNKSIIIMFVAETFLLCLLGYLLGLILGFVGTHIVDFMILTYYDSIPASIEITKITPLVIGKVTLYAFLISVLGSVFPSYFTGKIPPITAIRRV